MFPRNSKYPFNTTCTIIQYNTHVHIISRRREGEKEIVELAKWLKNECRLSKLRARDRKRANKRRESDIMLKATSGWGSAVSNRETRTLLSQWRGDTPELKVLAVPGVNGLPLSHRRKETPVFNNLELLVNRRLRRNRRKRDKPVFNS